MELSVGNRGLAIVMLRQLASLAIVGAVVLAPTAASAKGSASPRGYAVLTGPGLPHPIVISAPWDREKGGYYGSEAEVFLTLATYSGAIPAGMTYDDAGDVRPEGVVPLTTDPNSDGLGPRYRMTWFRDDLSVVATQDIYPFSGGLPYVFNFASSRRGLIAIFGRFQNRSGLWAGWGRSTGGGLLTLLHARGLPETNPTEVATAEPAASSSAPGSPIPFGRWLVAVLVIATAGSLLLRRAARSSATPLRRSRRGPGTRVRGG
jgi:hypothetical protein